MRLLLILICIIYSVGNLFSTEYKIENDFFVLKLTNKGARLESKNSLCLKVNRINIVGNLIESTCNKLNDNVWGEGEELVAVYDNGRILNFRLYKNNPFLHISTSVKNSSGTDISVNKSEVLSVEVGYPTGKKVNSLGTGGLSSVMEEEGSFTYSLIVEPESRNAVLSAWLTQLHGLGTFTLDNDSKRNYCRQNAELEFGKFLVKNGETRTSDILIVGLFPDGRVALETYGEHLAKQYDIKLPKRPEVYCTWYHRNLNGSGASNEKDLIENARFAKKTLADFGLNTFQIDDHWQSSMIDGLDYRNVLEYDQSKIGDGPFKSFEESDFNFPSGMAKVSDKLNSEGFTSGIWFMPFAGDVRNKYFDSDIFAKRLWNDSAYEAAKWSGTCIDATNPKGEDFLRKRFKRIYDWGYRYFKIDGLHIGAPSENVYINREYKGGNMYGEARLYSEKSTFVEGFRKGLELIREEAPDAFLLGCSVTQNMSSFGTSFGLVDAMRVGPDNDKALRGDWENVTRGADYAGNLYFLNNRVWYNDPDPCYVRETNPIDKARWMVSWQAVSGVMFTTSMQYSLLSEERLDLIKRALPTHTYNARPVDILENEKPMIWKVDNERMTVLGLFNWFENEKQNIKYSFEKLGLTSEKQYELFDFWENRYLGRKSDLIDETLNGASCKVLAVKEVKTYPQVISTSRHITQGLIDIVDESWSEASKTLSGISKVVKGDRYELRIIVPENFKLKEAKCNGKKMDVYYDNGVLRVSFLPKSTGLVKWTILFK